MEVFICFPAAAFADLQSHIRVKNTHCCICFCTLQLLVQQMPL